MKRNRTILKSAIAAALLGTAFGSPAALAINIDFEDTMLTTVDGNQSLVSRGYTFTAADSELAQFVGVTGAVGGVYSGALGCGDTPCPAGNDSRFYVGLNDGSATVTRNGERADFKLRGLDFGFLAPTPGLPDGTWGQLRLTGYELKGGTVNAAMDFGGQNALGEFMFNRWTLDQSFSKAVLGSLSISACMYDETGACNNSLDMPAMNLAQFAIDNLSMTEVPEPAAPALLMLGALGMALSARRRVK